MRIQTLSKIFLVLTLLSSIGHADPSTAAIQKKAEENAKALVKGDFETIAKNTYPKLVEMLEGQEKMISTMKDAQESMAAKGFKIVSVTVGDPSPVTVAGDKMYSVVPSVMVVTTPEDKITQSTFLLAVSTDKGANWFFLDGSGLDSDNVLQIIPDFPSTVKLPEKEPAKEEPIIASKSATP